MAVLMGGEVVQTVCVAYGLGIGEAFAHFFDASVDIAAMHIHFLDGLPFERNLEVEHAVGGGVLRAYVDHVFVFLETEIVFLLYFPVFFAVGWRDVVHRFGIQPHGIDFRAGIVVLAQGIADPVVSQEEAAHVGMPDEDDAEEVVDFPFVEVGDAPPGSG